MGNQESVVEELVLQEQDSEHLWQLVRRDPDVDNSEGYCVFSTCPGRGTQAERCKHSLQHLRLLRHPNIVKFLDSEVTPEFIFMKTEVVVPLCSTLADQHWEGLVRGWRDVAHGLEFLHYKARVSHNNVHVGSVYVGGTSSQWKLAGFEAAHEHKTITPAFINSISSIRSVSAIPPEDKGSVSLSQPIHCRDVWGLGQLMVQCIEDSELQSHVPEEVLVYIGDEMQTTPAANRSSVCDLLQQPWMSNDLTAIVEFLINITLHSQESKDQFFSSLLVKLHSLSPMIVAEHIIPPLCTPLVMVEPKSSLIWPHLLCPASKKNPRPEVLDPCSNKICPLLKEELFKAHVLPPLLDLLETRDSHVRMILLNHIGSFAYLCSREELTEFVLPEILLGLKERDDEIVAATLHALSCLVPILGSATVMGTSKTRRSIFTDSKPKVSGGTPSPSPSPSFASTSSVHVGKEKVAGNSTEDRLEKIRRKREEQRRKREEQIKKRDSSTRRLGVMSTTALLPPSEDEEEEQKVATEVQGKARKKSVSQYSPSVSHDEEEEEIEEEEEEEDEKDDYGKEEEAWEGIEVVQSPSSVTGRKVDGSKERSLNQTGWNESRTKKKPLSHSTNSATEVSLPTSSSPVSIKAMKLSKPGSRASRKSQAQSTTQNTEPSSKLRENLKGRMSEDDIARLETQLLWSQQDADMFADLEPEIPASTRTVLSSPPVSVHKAMASPSKDPPTSLSLQPQTNEVEVGGGWGDDGWDDF